MCASKVPSCNCHCDSQHTFHISLAHRSCYNFIHYMLTEAVRMRTQFADRMSGVFKSKLNVLMVARKRSVDFGLLTHPPVLKSSLLQRNGKPSSNNRGGRGSCELRMQQSTVDVFTRFIIDTNTGRRYFCGKKVYLRITDLVQSHLRVADPDIASIKGTVVRGHLPGRTEVQVSVSLHEEQE